VAICLLCYIVSAPPVNAQKLAILTPEKTGQNVQFVSELENSLGKKLTVLDNDLSESAYRSVNPETPFNMLSETARNIGAVIGCDYYLLIRSGNQRRTSLEKSSYFEAFAAVFVVSSRTGRLVFWRLQKFEAPTPAGADVLLSNSVDGLAVEITGKLKAVMVGELAEKPVRKLEEIPAEGTPEAKSFRPPMPYKRVKPEYTSTAYLYGVAATVDVQLDVDESGNILHLEIVRWAGYGLDEAVTEAIRKMNWRAGERNGKSLPVRVLLRYNFKKIEKEE
jgi:TonB family protein